MDILKELHASVAEAYEASFDTAYRKLESKLASQQAGLTEDNRSAFVANEARHAAEQHVNRLEQEILALKDNLKTYECSPDSTELPGPFTNLKEDFAPENVWHEGLRDVDNMQQFLEDKYSTLYNNLQTMIAAWWGLKTKVLQHKNKLKHWETQLEREEFTLVLNDTLVTFRRVQGIQARGKKPMLSSLDETPEQAPSPEPETSRVSHLTPKSFRVLPNNASSIPKPRIKDETTSQQPFHGNPLQSSTNSNPSHHSPGPEPSSDTVPPLPDVQNRKRKRIQESSHAHPIEVDPHGLVSVKNEPMSLSPLPSSVNSPGPPLSSTQDLDDIGDTVQTPTKQRVGPHLHDAITGSDSSQVMAQGNSPGQFTQSASLPQSYYASVPILTFVRVDQRPSHTAAVMMVRQTARQLADWRDLEHNGEQRPSSPTSAERARRAPTLAEVHISEEWYREHERRLEDKRKREDERKREQIPSHRAALAMAEDGDHEHNGEQSSKNTSENTPAPHRPTHSGKSDTNSTRNRLLGLLDGATTPSKSPFSVPRKQDAIRSKGREPLERARSPLQPDENAPEVRPEDEPYRSWPLHQLGIDQFKINTARNQGFDFAYDSVTRKKDERKCLSGCTRPGCCGDRFRAMARLGGPAANSTAEQTEEDQRILEEYVGDDREKLKRLSAHDRENLLVDARARVLANQYGRHRHSHQRAQSPPGFWRTDMPSTQEMESDREAAQRQERDKVEERYREAMRPGGLWKFADE